MTDIVISEFMDERVVAEKFAGRDHLYDARLVDDPPRLRAALADARALIVRNRTEVGAALLGVAPRLVAVGRLGVGLNNIDVALCRSRGIEVYPATGANDLAVAEYVIAAAMTLLRGAFGASAEVAAGAWPRSRLMGRETAAKTIGFVGFGAIARATAARARALGMTAIAFDPYLEADDLRWEGARRVSLGALLDEADVVSVHTPLTDETRGLIDAAAIARMKKGAILINAARGGIVDERALAEALRSGALGGAALDVFEAEPVTGPSGAIFSGVPNIILTPHIAGVTVESNARVSLLVAERTLARLDSMSAR